MDVLPDLEYLTPVTPRQLSKTYSNTENKKAELSQRWPCDALYVWVPWKFSGVPDYAHGYFSRNC